ncbi:MAG: ABC transporter permease subunit [Actinobacteria bacterium]|nr:ABC transporter permease subunit [Actinomycetota bacterium]
MAPAVGPLVLLFGGALVGAVRTSVQPGAGGTLGAVDLSAWRTVLTDPAFGDALLFTVRVTLVSTVISAILAVLVAALLRCRGGVVRGLVGLPVLVPHLIVAVVAVLWLGPGGLADRLLGSLPLDLVRDRAGWGIVLVYVYKEAPFLALLVLAAWDGSVAEREEAAAVLGAGRVARMRLVVWPSIRAPLAVGALIVAAFAFGSFEVPLVVGPSYPPTVAVYALDQTRTSLFVGQARSAVALLVAAGVSLTFAVATVRQLRNTDVV